MIPSANLESEKTINLYYIDSLHCLYIFMLIFMIQSSGTWVKFWWKLCYL